MKINIPRISVIIPCYNVDAYIKECVESVIVQTFTDIEVIIVDDGSTDQSPQICEDLAKEDERIRVVHKTNGGLSDARNVGTELAVGEYLFYLDGDDALVPTALSLLYNVAQSKDADIVQGNFYYDYTYYLLVDNRFLEVDAVKTLSVIEAMEELLRNRLIKNFAWGKLIRTNLAKKYPFVKGVYFEDSYWMYKLVDEARNYTIVNTPLCYYRQRREGISGTFSLRHLDLLKGMEQRLLFVFEKYPMFADLAMNRYWETAFIFSRCSQGDDAVQYKDYLNLLCVRYQSQLKKSVKTSFRVYCLFHLWRQMSFLLPLWFLGERIYHRLFSKNLKKVIN